MLDDVSTTPPEWHAESCGTLGDTLRWTVMIESNWILYWVQRCRIRAGEPHEERIFFVLSLQQDVEHSASHWRAVQERLKERSKERSRSHR